MTDARTTEDPLVYTRTVVGHAAYHAGQQGRTDLVERLERHRVLLEQLLQGATVAVVGLCDAGKSSLINAAAWVRRSCRSTSSHPMPVPVVVRAGDGSVRIHQADQGDDRPSGPPASPSSSRPSPPPASRLAELRLVEVGCPAWTRPASLVFVDTPSQSSPPAPGRC